MFSKPEPEPKLEAALVTASIPRRPKAPSLSDHLGPEDERRALAAMAVALDPQGNGKPAGWDNAESGASGRFTPTALPFLKDDEICRPFRATIKLSLDTRTLDGLACRLSGAEWTLRELRPAAG